MLLPPSIPQKSITMKKTYLILAVPFLLAACSNENKSGEMEINDSTTPLHLMKPDYKVAYGDLTQDSVANALNRVYKYIESVTPARVVDSLGNEISSPQRLPDGAKLNQGTFRLTSYEWAVTYMALLKAADILGNNEYKDYVTSRMAFLSKWVEPFKELAERTGSPDRQMRQVMSPGSLDDAGAMSGAFMLGAMTDTSLCLDSCIERYYDIVEHGTHRLSDGTIARNRPHHNAVWLDDMFMALPAMAVRSVYTGKSESVDEAAEIASGFIKRMWMPEKKIFRHGFVEGHNAQPSMAWGRANGWALLTMTVLLDYLPENHPRRQEIMGILRDHITGLAALQGKDGFWHQLLDRPDSYEETSATAIFTYAISHAVNEGWIDPVVFGPVAHLGWEALNSKITATGEVEGVCVGTGMAFDPAFYYYRPVSTKAAHGYGPAILAAAEMYRLLGKYYPRVNDAAVHYYSTDPEATVPIFSLDSLGKATEILH